jgi:hypothetical protein
MRFRGVLFKQFFEVGNLADVVDIMLDQPVKKKTKFIVTIVNNLF